MSEKIVLKNNVELPYSSIGRRDDCLVIGFVGGDAVALEETFRSAGQDNLEKIRQLDGAGNEQAIHELYDIFKAVNKLIGAAADGSDVVEIVLAQETALEAEIRHLKARVSATEEVTDTLLMEQLA